MDQTLRLFIALDLPAEVKALLAELQAQLQQHAAAVRWSDPGGTHLTLKFLGDVPDVRVPDIQAELRRAAAPLAPFRLQTTALGVFPNGKRPRVVWLGVGGALHQLHRLKEQVEQHVSPLGFPPEQRAYNPHLTLGRSFKEPSPGELASIQQAVAQTQAQRSIAWNVAEVVLMRSELRPGGARYTPLAHVRLDGHP